MYGIYGSISETSLDISSQVYDRVQRVSEEKGIALDLIHGVSEFLLTHAGNEPDRRQARLMNLEPIREYECQDALDLIEKYKDESIFIVDNKINHDEASGLNKFYWEHKISLSKIHTAAWLSSRQITQIKATSASVDHFFLTITKQAVNALSNYKETLHGIRLEEEKREKERLEKKEQWKIDYRENQKKQAEAAKSEGLSPRSYEAKREAEYEDKNKTRMQELLHYYQTDDEQLFVCGDMSIEERIEKGYIKDPELIHYLETKRKKSSCCTLF